MKKGCSVLLCLLLAAAMTISVFASIDVGDYKDKDGDTVAYDTDEFSIDDPAEDLRPGGDYYFKAYWGDAEMDDDFFDNYLLTQSIVSDTEGVSNAAFRKYIRAAEFVKGSDGSYYYHVGIASTKKNDNDLDGGIVIYARDRKNSDDRAAYALEFTIGYVTTTTSIEEGEEEYDLSDGGEILNFEKGIKRIDLTFFNDSKLALNLGGKAKKLNFTYDEVVNESVQAANPGANLQQMSFYGRPTLPSASVFKFYAGPDAKYFYELRSDNSLVLLSQTNASGYFGVTTEQLGVYLASDVALKNAVTAAAASSAAASASEAAAPSAAAPAATAPAAVPKNPSTGAAL